MENMMLALSLLLAGFIIVFLVLILLIIVITIYGKIIQAAQKSSRDRKERKIKRVVELENINTEKPGDVYIAKTDTDEIPPEIIAVIAAAVAQIATESGKQLRIRSVKRVGNAPRRSAWSNAAAFDSMRSV